MTHRIWSFVLDNGERHRLTARRAPGEDEVLCFFDTRIAIDQSCDRPCHHSSDDLDRNANCKTKLAVSAPLIDGDFNKPI
jgi:hypothetical protein